MSSSDSSIPDRTPLGQPHTVVPNFYIPDAAADEMNLASSQSWMVATVIEDDDLMFGGKPLCAWYEEDRRRLSLSIEEEETRGRQRERVPVNSHHQKAHHQHQHQHQHHRHHSKTSKDSKK